MPVSFIDPTATVEPPEDLGQGCRDWHYAHTGQGAIVGAEGIVGEGLSVGSIAVVVPETRLLHVKLDQTAR